MQEVGGPQADAVRALLGSVLHQPGLNAVAGLEVSRQAPQEAAQDMARQVRTAHRGTDQEAAQADHAVEMRPALVVAPADLAVPGLEPLGRGGEPCGAKPAMGRTHKVAHLTAGKGGDPMGMFPCHQRVPQLTLRRRLDRHNRETVDPRRVRWNPDRCGNVRVKLTRPVIQTAGPRRRRDNLRRPLGQCRQRLHAAGQLKPAGRVDERELPADPPPQRASAAKLLLRQNRRNLRPLRLAAQGLSRDTTPCQRLQIIADIEAPEEIEPPRGDGRDA